jgi:long-chain acyl-CoA synthetase
VCFDTLTIVTVEASPTSAGRAVARLARVVEHALADDGLSLAQYRLLSLLAEGTVAATALADHLAVTRPSVTALVDGLVQRGMVERRPDPVDRRRVGHALTPAGRQALAAAERSLERHLDDLAARLEPEVADRARDGLEAWHVALDAARSDRMSRR